MFELNTWSEMFCPLIDDAALFKTHVDRFDSISLKFIKIDHLLGQKCVKGESQLG